MAEPRWAWWIVSAVAAPLSLAAAQRSAAPVGWVRDSTGAPIGDADVSVPSIRLLVHSDSGGTFRLSAVGPGIITLNVRRLGYQPQSLTIQIRSDSPDSIGVTLRAIPRLLEAVRAGSPSVHRDFLIEDFYRRQARGPGLFITRADIDRRNPTLLSDMVRQYPAIRIIGRPGRPMAIRFPSTSMARRDCPPQYWVDGRRVSNFELDELPPGDIEGIELYTGPSSTPMQFTADDTKTCGTVVVWSRPPGER